MIAPRSPAFRGPIASVAAVKAATRSGMVPEAIAVAMVREWEATQPLATRDAIRAYDLGQRAVDDAWLTAELGKRRAFYVGRVLPLLRQAGLSVDPELASRLLLEATE